MLFDQMNKTNSKKTYKYTPYMKRVSCQKIAWVACVTQVSGTMCHSLKWHMRLSGC